MINGTSCYSSTTVALQKRTTIILSTKSTALARTSKFSSSGIDYSIELHVLPLSHLRSIDLVLSDCYVYAICSPCASLASPASTSSPAIRNARRAAPRTYARDGPTNRRGRRRASDGGSMCPGPAGSRRATAVEYVKNRRRTS
jgi:hypothetical protein